MFHPSPLMFVVLLLCLYTQANAQQPEPIVVTRSTDAITIDGMLSETSWFNGKPASGFWQLFPTDSIQAAWDTEIFMTFDDKNLYVGAKCYAKGNNYIVPSLRRDYRASGNDNITFIFDTFRDRTNAIVFGMNPLGVTREALISNGGLEPSRDFDEFWDNKWQGASAIHDGYWSCELAIPFSSLRFNAGDTLWYFNSYRFDMQANVQSTWHRIPQNQSITSLAFVGQMIFEEPLQKPRSGVAIIPYLNTSANRRFNAPDQATKLQFNAGADAKVQVSAGLNLDLTINPDFSQVEVDRQVINLDRFEIFFPERRQFFLENADLFSSFGNQRIRPFFSRRIGVSVDPTTGQNIQNPIYGGARLSGKIDNNLRLGLLTMQTAPNDAFSQSSLNYTVAALQRKIFTRSNLSAIFVNKQTLHKQGQPFNRLAGLDYNIANADNSLTGKIFYHHSFSPDNNKQAFAHGSNLQYRVKKFALGWEHQWVGDGFNAEVGFVPRKNFFSANPSARYFLYPGKGPFSQHNLNAAAFLLWMPTLGRTDHEYVVWWDGVMRNTGFSSVLLRNQFVYLFRDFDPSGSGGTPLPAGEGYNFSSLTLSYQSDVRPLFSYRIEQTLGQYFNGQRIRLAGAASYRFQPYGSASLEINYNYTRLPAPYASGAVWLLGPRLDLTFSRSVFVTAFFQYNQQIDNVNVNARLQWRYAPVSDLFLVYTDNYDTNNFNPKNRAIILKWTYWINT
jgi:hypothetical protein